MIKVSGNLMLTLLIITICGCTAQTTILQKDAGVEQSTYVPTTSVHSLNRSTGLLKRLALLPLMVKISPKNSRQCMDPCDPDGDRVELVSSVVNYLIEWRGYEIERFDLACQEDAVSSVLNVEVCALGRSLLSWSQNANVSDDLPQGIANKLSTIGDALNVDGFLFLHGKFDYVQWIDALHWAVTLTASAHWDLARGNVAKIQVGIFSVADRKRVWLSKSTITQFGNPTYGRGESYGESIMAPLEPAVPTPFIRSRTKTREK